LPVITGIAHTTSRIISANVTDGIIDERHGLERMEEHR
jgi:hypothetical protein